MGERYGAVGRAVMGPCSPPATGYWGPPTAYGPLWSRGDARVPVSAPCGTGTRMPLPLPLPPLPRLFHEVQAQGLKGVRGGGTSSASSTASVRRRGGGVNQKSHAMSPPTVPGSQELRGL